MYDGAATSMCGHAGQRTRIAKVRRINWLELTAEPSGACAAPIDADLNPLIACRVAQRRLPPPPA